MNIKKLIRKIHNMLNVATLNYSVVSVASGRAVAAFILKEDALSYIEYRRKKEGPHGPLYEIQNANGAAVSPELAQRVVYANAQ